jgi:hypothetical protein
MRKDEKKSKMAEWRQAFVEAKNVPKNNEIEMS